MTTDTGLTVTAGTYTVDTARSLIRFRATHSFGLGPVSGTFAILDGTFTVAPDPAECAATARIDASSFKTDKARRDKDITSKRFLNAAEHPQLVFVSDRLTREDGRWLLGGALTVRGVTAPVTLEVTPTADGGCRFQATARIDRYAHRVGPRGIIGRYIDVEFDIVGS